LAREAVKEGSPFGLGSELDQRIVALPVGLGERVEEGEELRVVWVSLLSPLKCLPDAFKRSFPELPEEIGMVISLVREGGVTPDEFGMFLPVKEDGGVGDEAGKEHAHLRIGRGEIVFGEQFPVERPIDRPVDPLQAVGVLEIEPFLPLIHPDSSIRKGRGGGRFLFIVLRFID
jgi:hypothetical protein